MTQVFLISNKKTNFFTILGKYQLMEFAKNRLDEYRLYENSAPIDDINSIAVACEFLRIVLGYSVEVWEIE